MPASTQSQSRTFHHQLLAGRIELWIEGEIIRGSYLMENLGGGKWRMCKLDDEFAFEEEPIWTGVSVISHLTLDDL